MSSPGSHPVFFTFDGITTRKLSYFKYQPKISNMRSSFFTLAALGACLVAAAPATEKRTTTSNFNAPPGGDVTIANYALTLEYLERKFYQEGLANYTREQFIAAGFSDPFYDNLKEIYYDEKVSIYQFRSTSYQSTGDCWPFMFQRLMTITGTR